MSGTAVRANPQNNLNEVSPMISTSYMRKLKHKKKRRINKRAQTMLIKHLKNISAWDFPGGPVVKIPCFQCRGHGFHSWSGNKIPHTTTSQIKKKKKKYQCSSVVQSCLIFVTLWTVARQASLYYLND